MGKVILCSKWGAVLVPQVGLEFFDDIAINSFLIPSKNDRDYRQHLRTMRCGKYS